VSVQTATVFPQSIGCKPREGKTVTIKGWKGKTPQRRKAYNPTTYVDIRVDSDRFDGEPDRYYVTVWADLIFKVFCFGLFEGDREPVTPESKWEFAR
jgi:hypothetical protein